jgi:hypothetical protein
MVRADQAPDPDSGSRWGISSKTLYIRRPRRNAINPGCGSLEDGRLPSTYWDRVTVILATMFSELLKNIPNIALILSAAALALVGVVFALFLRPKLKVLDNLTSEFQVHAAHFQTLKVADNLNVLQKLQMDVALLQQSESQRNEKLNAAIDAQRKSIAELEDVIAHKVEAGDNHNMGRYLSWRVDQLETAYALARLQGGIKEDDARERWLRAKDDLAKFSSSHQNPAASAHV